MKIFKKSIFFSLTLLLVVSVSNIFAAQKRKLSYPEKTRRFLQRYIKPVVGGLAASVLIIGIALFCFDQKKKLEEAEKARLSQAEAARKAEVERLEAAAQAKIKVAEAQAKTRIEEARVESQAAIKVAEEELVAAKVASQAAIKVAPVPAAPAPVAIPEEKAHPAPVLIPVAAPAPVLIPVTPSVVSIPAEKVRLSQAEAARKAEAERLEAAAQAAIKVAEAQAKTRIEEARVESQAAIKVAEEEKAKLVAAKVASQAAIKVAEAQAPVAIPEEKAHPAPVVIPVAHPAPEPVKPVPVEIRQEDQAFYQELLSLLDEEHKPYLIKELLNKRKGNNPWTFSPSQNMFSSVGKGGVMTDLNTCSIFAIANAIADIETGPDRIKKVQRLATTIFNYIPKYRIGRMLELEELLEIIRENNLEIIEKLNQSNVFYINATALPYFLQGKHTLEEDDYLQYFKTLRGDDLLRECNSILNLDMNNRQKQAGKPPIDTEKIDPKVFSDLLLKSNFSDEDIDSLKGHSILGWTERSKKFCGERNSICLETSMGKVFNLYLINNLIKIKNDGRGKFIIYVDLSHFICVDYDVERSESDKFILRDSYNPSIGNVGRYGNLLQNLKLLLGCE